MELCTSADIDSPSVIGFWSPRLLVPEWLLAKLTLDDMRQIVLHELEHLRRRDDWLNLMQKVGLVLFPLNPGLLWVDRKLAVERELACDAGVSHRQRSPLNMRAVSPDWRSIARSIANWHCLLRHGVADRSGRRVLSLVQPANTWSPRHARFATVLLLLVLAGGSAEMARVPHFVTFADSPGMPAPGASATVAYSQPAVPVVYRETSQPRATLLKAVMPPACRSESLAARKLRQQPLRKARGVKLRQQPRMVLTAAGTSSRTTGNPERGRVVHTVYVLPDEFSPSYAAVPFANGWLIVQL